MRGPSLTGEAPRDALIGTGRLDPACGAPGSAER